MTANTSSEMMMGFAVIFVILSVYIVSIIVRTNTAKRHRNQ